MIQINIWGFIVICIVIWIIVSLVQIRNDVERTNVKLSKIADKLGIYDDIKEELKKLISEGKKIEAIKKYRIATGAGLKEATDYVDSLSKE